MVLGMYDVNYTSCSITLKKLGSASLRILLTEGKHLKAFLLDICAIRAMQR